MSRSVLFEDQVRQVNLRMTRDALGRWEVHCSSSRRPEGGSWSLERYDQLSDEEAQDVVGAIVFCLLSGAGDVAGRPPAG